MEVYKAGFTGGSVPESTEWMRDKVLEFGAKRILVPFAGIGRAAVAMSSAETIIDSFDTMHYARCIIDGVFNAKEAESNIDGIRYRKGWAYENRPFKNMDERSAGFIDWVAQEGTLFDKACLGSAMVRCTLMARMMHWHANVEQLYSRIQKQAEYNLDWLNQQGTFNHTEGNFYDSAAVKGEIVDDPEQPGYKMGVQPVYDLVFIDPPKVVNYSDVYSLHYAGFNNALVGERVVLPKWSRRNSMGQFRKAMSVNAPMAVFMYVSKVFPLYEDVKKMLTREFGEIVEEQEFTHMGRTDYGLVIRKQT